MQSCAPIPALAANFIDRRLASQAPGLLQGRAVVAVVVLLLPSVNRSFESLAVPGPHRVDERVPGLALSGPFLVVVLGGRLLDGLHELGVVEYSTHPTGRITTSPGVLTGPDEAGHGQVAAGHWEP
jgi:hypothetical protein